MFGLFQSKARKAFNAGLAGGRAARLPNQFKHFYEAGKKAAPAVAAGYPAGIAFSEAERAYEQLEKKDLDDSVEAIEGPEESGVMDEDVEYVGEDEDEEYEEEDSTDEADEIEDPLGDEAAYDEADEEEAA